MKRLLVAFLFLFAASLIHSDAASAQNQGYYGFLPFGFYRPYGATYSTSIRTPPYFSTNPPVYYGERHARPYGMSPFASPPLVNASENYKSRLRTQFLQPRVPTPEPIRQRSAQPLSNPCVSHSNVIEGVDRTSGVVRYNPFVNPAQEDRLVRANPFVESSKEQLATN